MSLRPRALLAVDTYAWVLEEAKHHDDDDFVVGWGLRGLAGCYCCCLLKANQRYCCFRISFVLAILGVTATSASARTPWETVPAGTSSALLGLDAAPVPPQLFVDGRYSGSRRSGHAARAGATAAVESTQREGNEGKEIGVFWCGTVRAISSLVPPLYLKETGVL
uniref:Uncharacterized protein n=1 Tax=Oryza rufipogon TaxID=4529 RepID=A0A0E0QH57_ORYRU